MAPFEAFSCCFFVVVLPAWRHKLGGPGRPPASLTPFIALRAIVSSSLPARAAGLGPARRRRLAPMTAQLSLIDELERARAAGSNSQRDDMLSRITDLFVDGSQRYTEVQIGLFDEVFTKLSAAIEAKARAKLSHRLADVPNAPAGVVRAL